MQQKTGKSVTPELLRGTGVRWQCQTASEGSQALDRASACKLGLPIPCHPVQHRYFIPVQNSPWMQRKRHFSSPRCSCLASPGNASAASPFPAPAPFTQAALPAEMKPTFLSRPPQLEDSVSNWPGLHPQLGTGCHLGLGNLRALGSSSALAGGAAWPPTGEHRGDGVPRPQSQLLP